MTVGENIRRIRKERGLTQEELGFKVGLSGVAIMRYEKEQREPKRELLEKIASALSVTPADLMKGNPLWDEFDKQYPNMGEEVADFEDFKKFLESIGYVVKFVPEGESYSAELSKDGMTTEFSEAEFKNFRTETRKSVDYQVWQKSQEKK